MTISSLMPDALRALLIQIEELGFSLCLIGGATRDFLLQNILSHDLDFEIRNAEIILLKNHLEKNSIKYTELPYQILRVNFSGFDLEFSTPRQEEALLDNKTHHHFLATLNPRLDYKSSFQRRDFTINAIGIELRMVKGQEMIVDPYDGVSDLKQKILKKITDDFFLDSVRFLRLIRFSIKYEFQVSKDILTDLSRFDLSELSPYHFNEEMLKSGNPALFINRFNDIVAQAKIRVSSDFLFLGNFKCPPDLKSREDILAFAFFNHKDQMEQVIKFFSIPEKRLKDLKSFSFSWEALSKVTTEELIKLGGTPFSELSLPGILSDMKNLEDKKEWRKYFKGTLLIDWDDWRDEVAPVSVLEEIAPSMRSYYRYYLTVRRKFLA